MKKGIGMFAGLLLTVLTSAGPAFAQSEYVNVPISELNETVSGQCNGDWSVIKSLTCNSAASRVCINEYGAQGGIIQEFDPRVSRQATIFCAPGTQLIVSLSTLRRMLPDPAACAFDWSGASALTCNSAASRYCTRSGSGSGGFIQEFSPRTNAASILCSEGERRIISASFMARTTNNTCNDRWNDYSSLTCNMAASRICRNAGFNGGVVQEFNNFNRQYDILCMY